MSLISTLLRSPVVHIVISLFSFGALKVQGTSMEPNFLPGQYLLVNRSAYRSKAPSRGDVVTINHPTSREITLLKRIVGLPGERVIMRQGKVFINEFTVNEPSVEEARSEELHGSEWRLRDDEYFVLGDNLNQSLDSRKLGPIKDRWIMGKVWLSLWRTKSLDLSKDDGIV